MDYQDALNFIDRLTYLKTGKHLNDLERQVFIGSWQGYSYKEIYPQNPEYVEKYVGYKLWQKLSQVLGEKVSKKKIQGAIARAKTQQPQVFLSYRNQEPDGSLAMQLEEALAQAGYPVLRTEVGEGSSHSSGVAQAELAQIDRQLAQCDYFILLLSPQAALSEMVIEELRRVQELRDESQNAKPVVLAIRVNCPPRTPLNHDLRSYLHGIGYQEWNAPADTPTVVQAVLQRLSGSEDWETQAGEDSDVAEDIRSYQTPINPLPPLPVAEPELPKGQVRLASAFYVKDNCTAYFEDFLLSETDAPLVLGLDEVDRVFQHPKITDDFFALLRAWYEEAGYGDSDSDLWAKLRLVVVHSTEVYIPLDINQSPFNVGLPIELSEFSREQVTDLAQRHGLNWQTDQVEQLMTMVGGHPYLVRVALYYIARGELTLAKLVEIAPTEAGIYGDHLRRHLWNLQQHPELATAFAQVLVAQEPVELESVLAFKLHSMGLVQLRGNATVPRFELYRQYFRDRLHNVF